MTKTITRPFKLHVVDDTHPSTWVMLKTVKFLIQELKAIYCNHQMSHFHFHIKVTEI